MTLIESYYPLVELLAQLMPDTEVVLHDLTDLDHSIVAIGNNHISNRNVGDSATDLVLRILQNHDYNEKSYTPIYRSQSPEGKIFHSVTYFIVQGEELAGLLCFNSDTTPLKELYERLAQFCTRRGVPAFEKKDERPITETLNVSMEQIVADTLRKILTEKEIPPERMTQEEKIQIVAELNAQGVFLLKGAVTDTAEILKVSEVSIYRYLQKVKKSP